MTQIAFLRKAEIPNKTKIQKSICNLGYDFEILDDFENLYGLEGLQCKINGHNTFFEIYFNNLSEIIDDYEWIKPDLTDQDTTISFIWGADSAAATCIGLISLALIDYSDALIYYIDGKMKYSREMLVADTPQFLTELEKQSKSIRENQTKLKIEGTKSERKRIWDKIKDLFKQKI